MELWQIITSIIMGLISAFCLVYAFFASREKGPILSNTYLLASQEERKHIDKSAEYHLVTVVFGILGVICLLSVVDILTSWTWPIFMIGILAAIVIIYAIAEAIKTERNSK